MQRPTSRSPFYNFRNKFSYNFERSDQENNDRSVFDLKIIKKLNQKIVEK